MHPGRAHDLRLRRDAGRLSRAPLRPPPRSSPAVGGRGGDVWASSTWTSSPWAPPPQTPHFHTDPQPARTPRRVPGGRSGGAAAAVAAGRVRPIALGLGHRRLHPPAGRLLRGGGGAEAHLRRVSPATGWWPSPPRSTKWGPSPPAWRTTRRCCRRSRGQDPRDATSAPRPAEDFSRWIGRGVRDLRVALPREFFGEGLDAEVKAAVLASARQSEAAGAMVEEVSLPSLAAALPAYYVAVQRGGVLQPRPVRRRALRQPCGGVREHRRAVLPHAHRILWRRGQAAHPARHFRAVGGLLRRLL